MQQEAENTESALAALVARFEEHSKREDADRQELKAEIKALSRTLTEFQVGRGLILWLGGVALAALGAIPGFLALLDYLHAPGK